MKKIIVWRSIIYSTCLAILLGAFTVDTSYKNPFHGSRTISNTANDCHTLVNNIISKPLNKAEILSKLVADPDKGLTSEELRFIKNKFDEDDWDKWIDQPEDFLRFIRTQAYEAQKASRHGTEMYGTENYLAFKKADDYLQSIPRGKLILSPELFSEVHKKSSAGLFLKLKALKIKIFDGFLPTAPGVFKKRLSFGRDPLFFPLNEMQYENIMNNPWLSKKRFLELPYPMSKKGKRRGIILYAEPEQVIPKLNELISWYETHKNSTDPIRLAAQFQQAFVSIHPFVDGNGRASRLIMDRILNEHGHPVPLLLDSSNDLYASNEEWTKEVRAGINRYIIKRSDVVSPRNGGTLPKNAHIFAYSPMELTAKFNEYRSKKFKLGGIDFCLETDGFFYNQKGVPHIMHESTLYPISDLSYFLYIRTGAKATIGNVYKKQVNEHISFLQVLAEEKIHADSIKIEPYDTISDYNTKGKLHLYKWQRPLLKEIINLQGKTDVEILTSGFFRQTDFEVNGKKTLPAILGQYEKVDFQFWQYQKYVEENAPELIFSVKEARREIHESARNLMSEALNALDELPAEEKAIIENTAYYKVYQTYFQHSKLSYSNFDEALTKVADDEIVLLRSDASLASFVGFRSQQDYKKFYDKLPFSGKITEAIRDLKTQLDDPKFSKELLEKFKTKAASISQHNFLMSLLPAFVREKIIDIEKTYTTFTNLVQLMVNKFLANRYTSRGTSEEYERFFVDMQLHAEGSAPIKVGTSFSSNTNLYISSYRADTITFTNRDIPSNLFIVKVPKNKLWWNDVNTFQKEYEFVSQPVAPWKIVTKLEPKDLKEEPIEAKLLKAIEFRNNFLSN